MKCCFCFIVLDLVDDDDDVVVFDVVDDNDNVVIFVDVLSQKPSIKSLTKLGQ